MTPSDATASDPSYRGWLALVIILGALIFAALGALVAGFILVPGKSAGGSGEAYLATILASGGHIEGTQLDGNRILVRLSGGANGEELVVVDAGTGRVLGRIAVKANP